MVEIRDIEFNLLKQYLNSICGIDVPSEKRYLFKTRLAEFMDRKGCRTFSELYTRLTVEKDSRLQRHLIQAMTTHESSFFRDLHPFELFERDLLPRIAAEKEEERNDAGRRRIRVLSSGCSMGQEPYSIAMCVRKWLETQSEYTADNVAIIAVDISKRVLMQARRGIYSDLEVGKAVPLRYKNSFFTKKPGKKWQINEEIRGMVSFADVNLAKPFAYLGKYDIVFCRNVLIYFSVDLRKAVVKQFQRMMNPGGILILGASESLYNISTDFNAVHAGDSIYYVLEDT